MQRYEPSTGLRARHISLHVMVWGLACSHARPDSGRPDSGRPGTAPTDMGLLSLSEPGEQHRVSPDHAIKVGSGFNSLNEQVAGDCMENSSLTTLSEDATANSGTNPGPATARNDVVITYLEDFRRLAQHLGVRAEAHVRFFFASLSGEAEYANSSDFSRHSSFLLATATLRKETERLRNYLIKPDALELLKNNPRAFFKRCGDQFVAGRIKGASFTAIVEIRDTTEDTRQTIRGKVGAGLSLGSFGIGASFEKKRALEQALSRHELHYKVMSVGLPASNPTTIDEFIRVALNLQAKIDESANKRESAIEFITRSYEIADNFPAGFSLPSLANQDRFLDRLADYHQETSIVLKDLESGVRYPRAPQCADFERRRQSIIGNLEASNKRIEDRAQICLSEPERMCNMTGVPAPAFTEARVWLSECTDLEAHVQAKKAASDMADLSRRQAEEAKLRQTQEEMRRNRGRPGGLLCSQWLLQRVRVEVPSNSPDGGQWDENNGGPDLYIRLRVGTESRETNYERDATFADFAMVPPIPMTAGGKFQLTAWDYDGVSTGWFSSSVQRDHAVSVSDVIPGTIPDTGLRLGNARGTFYLFATCADPSAGLVSW